MPLTARLYGAGDLRVSQESRPDAPPEGWSTVAITSVGICGSDLHWFTEGAIGDVGIKRPVVPGHEFAGIARTGAHAGRRVAVDPAIPCGHCEQCLAGHGNLCTTMHFAGHGDFDGGLQEELAWPDHLLHPLPDSLSNDAGAMLEPLGVAIHAVHHAHVHLGDDVLVVGAGPIGLLSAQVARRSGAGRVFVSEPLGHRRDTALRLGADDAWAPEAVQDGLAQATGGRGVDVVLEMAGTDDAITTAVRSARPGARVALGGIPSEARSSFPASDARRKGLTFAMIRRMHETYGRAIRLATSGVDLDAIVSARYPLAKATEAFESAASRSGDKVIIEVSS